MASELNERSAYGGKYQIIHNPNARGRAPRYRVVSTSNEIKPKGVTTILGKTLAKDFVGWAVGCAIDYLRAKVPVVTEEDLEVASQEYIRLRDAGGSTGTEAHALVENYLKGQPKAGEEPPSEEAMNAFNAFIKWFEEAQPEVISVEGSIFSQSLEYCGTFDALLKIEGKVYLVDLKTTNSSRVAPEGVYADMFIQLGAYAHAYNEERTHEGEKTKLVAIDDVMIVSAKKNGALHIKTASDLGLSVEDCSNKFKQVLDIHRFMVNTTTELGGK